MVCTPRSPKCTLCPWNGECEAFSKGVQETLPSRMKTQPKPTRYAVAFVLFNPKKEVLLRRRPLHGLLGGMMEVPSSPWSTTTRSLPEDILYNAPTLVKWKQCPGKVTHMFSHFKLEVTVLAMTTRKNVSGLWVSTRLLKKEALPTVMKKIVRHAMKAL